MTRGRKSLPLDERLHNLKQSHIKYNKSHREQRNEWGRTLIQCGCGKSYTQSNRTRHLISRFHLFNDGRI